MSTQGPQVSGVAIQLCHSSPDQLDALSVPFFQAAAVAAFDAPVEMYFTGASVRLLKPGVADTLYSAGQQQKSVGQYMQEALSHGVQFYACTDALKVHGLWGQPLAFDCCKPGGVVQFAARLLDPAWRCVVY